MKIQISILVVLIVLLVSFFYTIFADSFRIKGMAEIARDDNMATGDCFEGDAMILGGQVCVERSDKVVKTFVAYRVYNSRYEETMIDAGK